MKKVLALIAALSLTTPTLAKDPEVKFFSPDATGCMILRECVEDVKQVFSLLDVSSEYDHPTRFDHVANEFNSMLVYLNQVGIDVFLADQRYFVPGARGIYHSEHNRFFLNKAYMRRPGTLMAVMRHEGYHAAQDCMAGTIENSMLAIIEPEENVPKYWQKVVEDSYPKATWPWEKEAFWAGHTENMTMNALRACASDTPMWEVYKPTPLTRKWLIENGFIQN
jgi:hypothetical protein